MINSLDPGPAIRLADTDVDTESLQRLSKDETTVLPAKSYSDVMLCLQLYQGIRIDRSLVY